MLKGMLHYQYIVTAVKSIIYNNIVYFFINTGEVSKTKLNLISA